MALPATFNHVFITARRFYGRGRSQKNGGKMAVVTFPSSGERNVDELVALSLPKYSDCDNCSGKVILKHCYLVSLII